MVDDPRVRDFSEGTGIVSKGQDANCVLQSPQEVGAAEPRLVSTNLLPRPAQAALEAMDENEAEVNSVSL